MREMLLGCGGMLLCIGAVLAVYWFGIYRKNPPYLKNPAKGRLPEDCIISVIGVARFGVTHEFQYHFVKRKSGRYRMKYTVLSALFTLFVVGSFAALYAWILHREWGAIRKYPEVALGYAFIGIGFAALIVLFLLPQIAARIYFRRLLRDYRKSIAG